MRKLHEQTEKEQVARDLEEFKRVVMGLDEKDARNEYKKIAEKWQVEEAPVKTRYTTSHAFKNSFMILSAATFTVTPRAQT